MKERSGIISRCFYGQSITAPIRRSCSHLLRHSVLQILDERACIFFRGSTLRSVCILQYGIVSVTRLRLRTFHVLSGFVWYASRFMSQGKRTPLIDLSPPSNGQRAVPEQQKAGNNETS